MTTAHRPTFDPARGQKNTQISGSIVHTRMLPAHTKLKFRQKGQGGEADEEKIDFKAQLLLAEEKNRSLVGEDRKKRKVGVEDEETDQERRKRILEENKDVDADSEEENEGGEDNSDNVSESESESDSDDETELLMKELEKIKREKAIEKQRQEEIAVRKAEEEREQQIAYGNPLLNPQSTFKVKRGWTEDTVFKSQASGVGTTSNSSSIGLMNDLIRSDFHRKFMDRYIR